MFAIAGFVAVVGDGSDSGKGADDLGIEFLAIGDD